MNGQRKDPERIDACVFMATNGTKHIARIVPIPCSFVILNLFQDQPNSESRPAVGAESSSA